MAVESDEAHVITDLSSDEVGESEMAIAGDLSALSAWKCEAP